MERCYKWYELKTGMFFMSLIDNTDILVNDNGILENRNPFVCSCLSENSTKHICEQYDMYLAYHDYIDIAHALYQAYYVIYSDDDRYVNNKDLRDFYEKHFYHMLQDVYDHNFYDSYIIKVTVFNICSNACQRFKDQSLLKYILKDTPVTLDKREKKYLMKYIDDIDVSEIVKKFDYYTEFMCENAKIWITLDNNNEHREYWSVPLDVLKSNRKINYESSDNYPYFDGYDYSDESC